MSRSLSHAVIALAVAAGGCVDRESNTIEGSGTIEGTEVRIASEVAGRIAEIRVEEGNLVRAGDTLAIIEATDYQLQLRQALAAASGAEAQYRLALEGARREDVVQSEAIFENACVDYERAKDLLTSGTITQKQYDDAHLRYVTAKQGYEKLSSGLRSEEVAFSRAGRDQAAAQVEFLRKKVSDCTIISRSDGIVTLKAMEEGEYVSVGGNLVRITKTDPARLVIYIAESKLGLIRLGQGASVQVDSHPDRSFPGTVVYISPVAEFTPKNVQTKEERTKLVFAVKIHAENSDGILKPGIPADATIHLSEENQK